MSSEILAALRGELGKWRHVGHCGMLTVPALDEQTDTLYIAEAKLIVLEENMQAVAFHIGRRVKALGDASPEQREQKPWQAGTLEEAAEAIGRALLPPRGVT